jgi:hypothetical protein
MKNGIVLIGSTVIVCLASFSRAAETTEQKTPKQALQSLNDLIGPWRGTGEPSGTREEKQRAFWQENINWKWRFKGEDVYFHATFERENTSQPLNRVICRTKNAINSPRLRRTKKSWSSRGHSTEVTKFKSVARSGPTRRGEFALKPFLLRPSRPQRARRDR